uniref:Uncharacterized protein n=1 Tax=Anopheles dirus TaxID=7168 RepID=A0A182NY52_9DIPT
MQPPLSLSLIDLEPGVLSLVLLRSITTSLPGKLWLDRDGLSILIINQVEKILSLCSVEDYEI